ncbi:MAG TPA: AbrB/MazE/SpoVT family DNA-binding domain-containing protein [Candidatus Competibacteraceae bacterium]|nr:AbrB/MazE/SpoVT family DNA-binding domain-containing protein [Candidatus Competibacteraceae bacterium]
MLTASLRRLGGSMIVTVPQSYVEQNHLEAGTKLSVRIVGTELCLKPIRQRPRLADLLAATPEGLHHVAGWDDMPSVGAEQ